MDRRQIPRLARAIRHRLGLRQEDAAARAGVSRSSWARFERDGVDGLSLKTLDAMLGALEATLEVDLRWRGAGASRVVDEGHARLVGSVVRWLERWNWQVKLEVSFSVYGERGSIDILAWDADTRTLAIFEIKTELGSVEGLLRPLDAKLRLAPGVAADRFGWKAGRVGCIVVFPESVSVRRQLVGHATVFDAAFGARSREVRRWLKEPSGDLRGCWFLSDSRHTNIARNPTAVRRVTRA